MLLKYRQQPLKEICWNVVVIFNGRLDLIQYNSELALRVTTDFISVSSRGG